MKAIFDEPDLIQPRKRSRQNNERESLRERELRERVQQSLKLFKFVSRF